jgi:hypothetical protein
MYQYEHYIKAVLAGLGREGGKLSDRFGLAKPGTRFRGGRIVRSSRQTSVRRC